MLYADTESEGSGFSLNYQPITRVNLKNLEREESVFCLVLFQYKKIYVSKVQNVSDNCLSDFKWTIKAIFNCNNRKKEASIKIS